MRNRYIIFLLWIFLLPSCVNNSNRSINDDGMKKASDSAYFIEIEKNLKREKPVLLRSIGKGLEYIPLETTPSSLMGEILHIQFTSDFIFITANPSNGLLQFDRKGKFIKQIGSKGRGPGEYIGGSRFCIDQENEKIFIMSCWSDCKIMEFNFNGDYIRSFDQPWESTDFFVYNTIGLVFEIADYSPSAAGVIPGVKDHSFLDYNLIITDFECNPLFKIKRHFIRNSNAEFGQPAFYNFNNELHFQQFGVDTLYILKNYATDPYAIYDLGKRKMDPNIIFTRSNLNDLKKQVENDIRIRSVVENQNNLFIKLNLGLSDSSFYCIYNKQTRQTRILKGNGITNDVDGGPDFWPKYVYNDSILVDYVDAYKFVNMIHEKKSSNLKNKNAFQDERFISLTETSNPILIVIK